MMTFFFSPIKGIAVLLSVDMCIMHKKWDDFSVRQ